MKTKFLCVVLVSACLAGCSSSKKNIVNAGDKDPKYQYNMGLFHLNNKNLDESIKFLNRSISLDSRYYLAYNALGLVYSLKGEFNTALTQFQRCLQIEPAFSEAHNNLGTLYQEMNSLDKAEQEFQKAADDPGYNARELPLYNLARLDFIKKSYEKALLRVDAVIKLNSRFAIAHNLRGVILESLDRLDEAALSYRNAVKYLPDDVDINFNLASVLIKNKETSQAKDILEKIAPLATDPAMREKITAALRQIKKQE